MKAASWPPIALTVDSLILFWDNVGGGSGEERNRGGSRKRTPHKDRRTALDQSPALGL